MKKGYYVCGYNEMCGVAVVASSVQEAKRIVYNADLFTDEDWIDLTSRWIRKADTTDMPIGVVASLKDGLKRGFYTYIEGVCESCGHEERLELYKGSALCLNCISCLGGYEE